MERQRKQGPYALENVDRPPLVYGWNKTKSDLAVTSNREARTPAN